MATIKVKGMEYSETCFSLPHTDLRPNSEYRNLEGGRKKKEGLCHWMGSQVSDKNFSGYTTINECL